MLAITRRPVAQIRQECESYKLVSSPSGLVDYQVDFRFPLLDLNQLADEEITGEPILQSTLRLLKYSRSQQLVGMLGGLLRLLARSLPESHLPEWIQAIGVYVMTVNKDIDAQQYKQTLKSVLPTQFEPGSLADRLLIQGREEGLERGLLAGKIQTLQELLGEDSPTPKSELATVDLDALTTKISELQQRLRDRQA
ncbi:MAG: hypothetical protein KDA72_07940 [Planctomycetales bacterium]|nr:hypothetical protein [Planctomycetales bacterium]